jgi:hypothetical protein
MVRLPPSAQPEEGVELEAFQGVETQAGTIAQILRMIHRSPSNKEKTSA